jgi:hypothetical protein
MQSLASYILLNYKIFGHSFVKNYMYNSWGVICSSLAQITHTNSSTMIATATGVDNLIYSCHAPPLWSNLNAILAGEKFYGATL